MGIKRAFTLGQVIYGHTGAVYWVSLSKTKRHSTSQRHTKTRASQATHLSLLALTDTT